MLQKVCGALWVEVYGTSVNVRQNESTHGWSNSVVPENLRALLRPQAMVNIGARNKDLQICKSFHRGNLWGGVQALSCLFQIWKHTPHELQFSQYVSTWRDL